MRIGVGVGGAELDDGAVFEAGAFAEGWGRWGRELALNAWEILDKVVLTSCKC